MKSKASNMNESDVWDESRMDQPTLLKYNVHTPLQGKSVSNVKELSKGLALPECECCYRNCLV